ncbi:MAG: glycosyltransferase family 4 protein [Candidatus Aegiribacteria sp.]|nr:glycosyltransferase family 4 protein [Candidatus Aegiribacteria sp.]
MLGKKDFHSGGYGFNFKMVEYLRSHGVEVDIIHFTTAPPGLPLKWFSASRYIFREIRRRKPGLVIVSKSYQYVTLLRLMSRFTGIPVLYLMHHLEWMDLRNKLKAFMYRMYVKWLLGMACRVWVNSRNTGEAIEGMKIPPDRIRLINPGFEKDPRPLPDRSSRHGPVRLLCVGGFSPRKAQHLLVKACTYLERGSFEIEFAGSIESEKEYVVSVLDMIREENLSDFIKVSGELAPEDLVNAYMKADILVHPASWEAFGMSILEGMWYGLPVISSDIAAIPELVRHGENGLLTPLGNAEDLAHAMNNLIRNRDLRLQMGKKSRMFAESMNDWNDTGKEFMELVLTAVRERSSE